ncbi:microtubule-associated protein tau [Tetranychus urticae]|uniref:microtubule-associated protein tau n=1 Tax=Tetranychus urticae TaxID=32264 RepID=UPI00077BA69C|nr:microtubule-associated protein tau [Tetranychus urticae]
MSDKPKEPVKQPTDKPKNGSSIERSSRGVQRSISRDSTAKSRDPSTCTSPTKDLSRKLPPIKAPVGLAKGPDLKNVRSKIGSLQNVKHRPSQGEKKVITQKLEWQAKPRIGSLDYVKHKPAGGEVKIENKKLEWKAKSKIGSLDNVKHKPGGGQVNIFDEKYARSSTGGRSPSDGRSISPSSTANSIKSTCNTPTGGRSPLPSSSSKDGKENKQSGSSEKPTNAKIDIKSNSNDNSKETKATDSSLDSKSGSVKADENNNNAKPTSRPNSLTPSTQSVKG